MQRPPAMYGKRAEPIPAAAGIGLRGPHHEAFLHERPAVPWLEAHSENYFVLGSVATDALTRIRADYPVSLHGVGLGMGSTDPLDRGHLEKLRRLTEWIEPGLVSEHLSWGSAQGVHANDLLPLPRTEEALAHVVARIQEVQDFLGRRISIENVSAYIDFAGSELSEPEFLVAAAERAGCGILLDINNVYVNAVNHAIDAAAFIDSIPAELVTELHLAGHSVQRFGEHEMLIDTHDAPIAAEVWSLYDRAVRRLGRIPTLIEWDSELPALDVLIGEAERAQQTMDRNHAVAA